MSRRPSAWLIVAGTVAFVACRSKDDAGPPLVAPPVLYVSPPIVEVAAGGGPVTFQALMRGASGTIEWSLQPSSLGALSSTSGDVVVYIPPAAVAVRTSVTLVAQGAGLTDAAIITVTPAPPAVAVTPPSACVAAGSGARAFVASVADGPGVITWSIEPPNVGTLSSSSGTAVTYTPPATLEATVVVTLTARAANAAAGSATIILVPDVGSPAATLQSISPARAIAGGPGLALVVEGVNFLPGAVIRWNGADRPTQFVSSSRLVSTIPQRDIARAGTAEITVAHLCAAPVDSIPFAIGHRLVSQVSVATSGTQPTASSTTNDARRPAISSDGRYVAFLSWAPDLVPGDGTYNTEVFVRDTCFGAPPGCAPSTERVRVRNNLETDLWNPTLTPDGRLVAFNGFNAIYVADTCRGAPADCIPSTEVVSVTSDGSPGADPTPWDPYDQTNDAALSADGRFVAFCSELVFAAQDANTAPDVYVRDTCRGAPPGCTPRTELVSVGPSGAAGGHYASISADGRHVAFVSAAGDLVAEDTNGGLDLFVRDTCNGAPPGCTPSTARVSLGAAGEEGNGPLHHGMLSASGRLVLFASDASNLVPGDTNGMLDVFVRDTCHEAPAGCVPTTLLASASSSGSQGAGPSGFPQASAEGRFVVFWSEAPDLVPDDTNGVADVFLRDTCRGAPPDCSPSTVRLSIAPDGAQVVGEGPAAGASGASISADGRAVVFTGAANLLPHVAPWNVFQVATCAVAGAPECEPGGTLRVTTATAGTDIDPDGFGVRLHGVAADSWTTSRVPPQGTATFHALAPGNYDLTLVGLAANCDPVTSPKATVRIIAGSTADASFGVSCASDTLMAFEYAPAGQYGVTLYEASSGGRNAYEIDYNGTSSEGDPAWAPHARGIAFTSEWHASICWGVHTWIPSPPYFLMSATCLDDPVPAYAPSWKPDGSRLAFTSERDGNAEIYAVNPDWTDPVRLTNDPASDLVPAWSPDGTRIAFARADAAGTRIVVMSSDGTGQTLLTSDDAEETDPAWSPDGTEVAYARRTCRDGTAGRECDPWDIYVRRVDGAIEPVALGSSRADALAPAWSPDGGKIAYTYRLRDSATELHDHDSAVALVRVDGTGPPMADPLRDEFMVWRGEDPSWRW